MSPEQRNRKRLRKSCEKQLQRNGTMPPGPWRWVHGVLYDRNDQELTRERPEALGLEGLPKPLERSGSRFPNRPREYGRDGSSTQQRPSWW